MSKYKEADKINKKLKDKFVNIFEDKEKIR